MESHGIDWSGTKVEGCCEYGNEPSCSVRRGEFLDQLRNWQVINKDSDKSYVLLTVHRNSV